MNHKYPSNYGYLLGSVDGDNIKLLDDLILGDGIQYVDKNFEKIDGIYVNRIYKNNFKVNEAYKGDVVKLLNIPKNTKYIYKNYSKKLNDEINKKIKNTKRYKKINVKIFAKLNSEMIIEFSTLNNFNEYISVELKSEILNEVAKNEISVDKIKEKINELGDTDFCIDNFEINYDNKVYIPFSLIKTIEKEN